MKHKLFKFYITALAVFTVFVLLDTFVLTKTYSVVESTNVVSNTGSEIFGNGKNEIDSMSGSTEEQSSPSNGKRSAGAPSKGKKSRSSTSSSISDKRTSGLETATDQGSSSAKATESSYSDSNIDISITTYEVNDTSVYVADIKLGSSEYLKTAFANSVYGKNVTAATSDIAEDANAILAINGDYYGVREKGYVLRNGVLYRSTAAKGQEDLVIYEDGSFEIINESEVTAEELLEKGAVQILSFGPALLENGVISVDPNDEVGQAKASNPRTAIGVVNGLHYLFIVSDGRTDESEGLSLYELALFAKELGAQTVYNLDGGGSSTMVFMGEVINNPTSGGSIKERKVSDIVFVGY